MNMFLVEMEDIKNRLSDLDKKLEIATSDMNSSNEEFENIKKQYTKLEADLEEINNSIEAKKTMSTDTVLKIEKLEGRILVLKEQINSAKNNEEFIAARVNAISSDIAQKEKNLTELCKEKDDNENVIQETIKSQSEITTDISVIKEEIENFDKEIAEHKAEIIEILNSKSMIKSKLQRCDTLLEQINIRKSQLNQKLIEFQSEKENQESKIEELKAELDKVNYSIDELNKTVSEYRNDLNDLRVENSKITKSISENRERYHKSKSNLEALKNITERYEGYGNSIKKVMELKENKKGIIGVVADIIKVEKKYEVAIETASRTGRRHRNGPLPAATERQQRPDPASRKRRCLQHRPQPPSRNRSRKAERGELGPEHQDGTCRISPDLKPQCRHRKHECQRQRLQLQRTGQAELEQLAGTDPQHPHLRQAADEKLHQQGQATKADQPAGPAGQQEDTLQNYRKPLAGRQQRTTAIRGSFTEVEEHGNQLLSRQRTIQRRHEKYSRIAHGKK